MHVVFQPSPSVIHKYRVILPNKRVVDFGKKGVEQYPYEIPRGMLSVSESTEADWERWLLWSYPNINHAKLFMTMQKGILFMPQPEDFWYC